MGKFTDKGVMITGASSGIGLALAREFAQAGANLILLARRLDRMKALETELQHTGARILSLTCDVTQAGSLEAAVSQAMSTFGRIDVVIAGAGFSIWGRVDQLSLTDYQRQFETNVFGVLRTLYATLSELKKSQGTFVLIGSVSGYVSLPGVSAYGMSKAAIHALAHSITPELKRFGVSVVLIAPGFVESEIRKVDNYGRFQPGAVDPVSQRLQMPKEKAAKIILSAIAAKRAEVVVTLHGKVAVFIQRHFPWLISAVLNRKAFQWRSSRLSKNSSKNISSNNEL